MNQLVSFLNKSLHKINQEADSVISCHLQDLNRISNDIKALEERLKTAGIPFAFHYVLSSSVKRRIGIRANQSSSSFSSNFLEHTDNCLTWGENQNGEYRLRYNIYVTENEIEEYEGHEAIIATEETRLFASTPLIETKSNFRLKIEKELPFFYNMIIEALKTKREQDCVVEYSPNYNLPWKSAKIDPFREI